LNKEGIKLAELGPGDSFGEEALIAGGQTQRHRHHGDGRNFDAAGQSGLPNAAERAVAAMGGLRRGTAIIAKGGKWLDVRLPSEFQNFRIDERSISPCISSG